MDAMREEERAAWAKMHATMKDMTAAKTEMLRSHEQLMRTLNRIATLWEQSPSTRPPRRPPR